MVTTPTSGQQNWDVTLNAALEELDAADTAHNDSEDAHGDRYLRQAARVDEFLADTPYYIAHRGSGGELPEHTMVAYAASVAAGAKAIEVSVHLTADGVPVCFHDTTLDRVTNSTGNIADVPYSELRETVRVTAQGLLGPGWADQPIPTLASVLDAFQGRVVVFLEAKSNDSIPVVQEMLTDHYPGAQKWVIWKGYYTNNSFAWAKNNGYTTWAYMDPTTTPTELDAVDANVDIWGVPHTMADADIETVVARGKQVICWEIHRHYDVDRVTNLGVVGYMAAQLLYLTKQPELTADRFTSQISPPGTLGVARYDPDFALQYDGAGGAYVPEAPNQSVLMGGHRVPNEDECIINFDMKWPVLPGTGSHSGIAFGKSSDDVYQFNTANTSGGYHTVIRGNGDIQLYTHTAGVTSGTQLGTLPTVTPVADTYMTFQVEVTPTQVILRRTDVGPYELAVSNTEYRGRYWHLSTGSALTASTPHFDNISVS